MYRYLATFLYSVVGVVTTLTASGGIWWAIDKMTEPQGDLEIRLHEPLPPLQNSPRNQLLIILNAGNQKLEDIRVVVTYPQAPNQAIDYSCENLAFWPGSSQLRRQKDLILDIAKLVPNEYIRCALSIPVGEVCPSNVTVKHDHGVILPNDIIYIALKPMRCR